MKALVLIISIIATGVWALSLAVSIARFRRFMQRRDEGPYGPTSGRSLKGPAPSRARNAISETGVSVTEVHDTEALGDEWILNHLGTVRVNCTPLHEQAFTWATTTEPQSPSDSDPTDAPYNDLLPRERGQDSGIDV